MATSKSREDSMFSLTSGARAVVEQAQPKPVQGVQGGADTAAVPAKKNESREIEERSSSIRLFKDQADLIFEMQYRARRERKSWTLNEFVRKAVDEYIVQHAEELMVTPDEARSLAQSAGSCE
ncbi:hypothetical protein [Adlercreutzia caecimuris]|uniref:hypothetical protein n=1 Tax=Adlercreutzia caecimuris TaxID=671266 RepID=UPI001C3CA73C|nr:hypothetical protein [Adlercreutzia caecimuris]